jgi:hypothetical protein
LGSLAVKKEVVVCTLKWPMYYKWGLFLLRNSFLFKKNNSLQPTGKKQAWKGFGFTTTVVMKRCPMDVV